MKYQSFSILWLYLFLFFCFVVRLSLYKRGISIAQIYTGRLNRPQKSSPLKNTIYIIENTYQGTPPHLKAGPSTTIDSTTPSLNILTPYPLGTLEAHTDIEVQENHPQETLPHTASQKSITEKKYIPDQYQVTSVNDSSSGRSSSHFNTLEALIKSNNTHYNASEACTNLNDLATLSNPSRKTGQAG